MIRQIGTKIYYCNNTGNVIKIIGDIVGFVRKTSFDEDYEVYAELKEREKSKIGLIEFAYGEYSKLCANSTGVKVNLQTKKLEFTYDKLPEVPNEPTELEIVQNKIDILEAEKEELKANLEITQKAVDFMMMDNGGM